MANIVFYGTKGLVVTDEVGATAAFSNTSGLAEFDANDASLLAAAQAQGAVRVDKEGTSETLTPGTVQTATTCSAIMFFNDAGDVVLNIRALNGTGTLLVGPITVTASKRRWIVFPTALAATGGVFIDLDSGTLDAAPGFLIP